MNWLCCCDTSLPPPEPELECLSSVAGKGAAGGVNFGAYVDDSTHKCDGEGSVAWGPWTSLNPRPTPCADIFPLNAKIQLAPDEVTYGLWFFDFSYNIGEVIQTKPNIAGYKVRVMIQQRDASDNGGVIDWCVRLTQGLNPDDSGTPIGDNKAYRTPLPEPCPNGFCVRDYGADNDLWGTNLINTDIDTPHFGVMLWFKQQAQDPPDPRDFDVTIGCVTIRVCFKE